MVIRINLLAEAQAAEEMRRKDPVKRSIWIASFVIFVVLLWAGLLQTKIMVARSEASRFQASWRAIEKQVKEVNDHRATTRELVAKLSALDQFTTNRTLWAPALNALQFVTPVEGVQLVRIKTEQSYIPGTGKSTAVSERIAVTMEGRDYSVRGGEQVPKFKQALITQPYFESMLARTNKIQLTSQTAPQLEFGRTFVGFGLKLFYEEKERQLYE